MGAGAWRTRSRERTVSRPTATTSAGQGEIALGESAPNAIRFNLVLPAAKMGFGPFSFDCSAPRTYSRLNASRATN